MFHLFKRGITKIDIGSLFFYNATAMNQASQPIVNLQQVSFSYGQVRALNQVTCTIEGGVFGLLGPNGAGKTTLLKILLGFLRPNDGRALVAGYDTRAEILQARRLIGYMPENDNLIPGLDAVSMVSYLGRISGMPAGEAIKRAHDVLYFVGLEEARYREVSTYSSGMKQRLKLAQALVHDPLLLLCDEPTSGMDPAGRLNMLELIRDIAGKGRMNVIISSHILNDIESVASSVLILDRGRLLRLESLSALKPAQGKEYEVHCDGDQEQFRLRLSGNGIRIESEERGRLLVTLPEGSGSQLLFQCASQAAASIRHLQLRRTSLEEAFLKALGDNDGH